MTHLVSAAAKGLCTSLKFELHKIRSLSLEDQNWILQTLFESESRRLNTFAEGKNSMIERIIDEPGIGEKQDD